MIGVAAARYGHGDRLEALIHKRLGLEEGGALSPSPQGAGGEGAKNKKISSLQCKENGPLAQVKV